MPRLSKALKKLNIGFHTAAEFLKEEFGLNVTSVNESISDEQYGILLSHFNTDKVLHSIRMKKYRAMSSSRKPNPTQVSYTEDEEKLLHKVEDINLTKYIRTSKGKKKKGEVVRARKGLGNNKKKTSRFDKAFGYVRIVSVPFGGMNKR
jgi:hypothetical protein